MFVYDCDLKIKSDCILCFSCMLNWLCKYIKWSQTLSLTHVFHYVFFLVNDKNKSISSLVFSVVPIFTYVFIAWFSKHLFKSRPGHYSGDFWSCWDQTTDRDDSSYYERNDRTKLSFQHVTLSPLHELSTFDSWTDSIISFSVDRFLSIWLPN